MNDTTTKMSRLEQQIEELLALCENLGDENSNLKAHIKQITGDRSSLLEQKEHARSQVEAMITRLRAMESA